MGVTLHCTANDEVVLVPGWKIWEMPLLSAEMSARLSFRFVVDVSVALACWRVSSPSLPQCTVTQMIHSNLIPSIIIFFPHLLFNDLSCDCTTHSLLLFTLHSFIYSCTWTHTHTCTDLIQDVCLITSKNQSIACERRLLLCCCVKSAFAVVITSVAIPFLLIFLVMSLSLSSLCTHV